MAWRIVKQPNGLLARFSDIVEDFTHCNMTEKEAFKVCLEETDTATAKIKVLAGVNDYKPWTLSEIGSGLDRWNDCISSIKNIHGEAYCNGVIAQCCTTHTSKKGRCAKCDYSQKIKDTTRLHCLLYSELVVIACKKCKADEDGYNYDLESHRKLIEGL